mmetsp:Transcript_7071/g.20105  ORF Transcript_7071/g.20105 Transcript_7071/m.20105 type:complete len:284 (+) Transcript_7071:964-1815(+)
MHDGDQASPYGLNAHDHLDDVSEGCVQKATDQLAGVAGQGLGGLTKQAGQRYDRKEIREKNRARPQVHKVADQAERRQNERGEVQLVAEDLPEGLELPSPIGRRRRVLHLLLRHSRHQNRRCLVGLCPCARGATRQHSLPLGYLVALQELDLLMQPQVVEILPGDLHRFQPSDCRDRRRSRLVTEQRELPKVVAGPQRRQELPAGLDLGIARPDDEELATLRALLDDHLLRFEGYALADGRELRMQLRRQGVEQRNLRPELGVLVLEGLVRRVRRLEVHRAPH